MSETPVEREAKLDVDDGYGFPDLGGIAGVTVDDRGTETLRAVYWDTDDLTLARAGVGLRHRNGTWTFKGRSRVDGGSVVREEREVDAPGDRLPPELEGAVARWAPIDTLHPVVEVDTERRTRVVRRAGQSAEAVDDVVRVRDRHGEVVTRWRGLEVEHDEASQPLAGEIVELLVEAGARHGHESKYLRALRAVGQDVAGVLDE